MKLPRTLLNRLSSRARETLELAEALGVKNSTGEITPDHLIAAIFQIRGSLAFNLLNIHRLKLDDVLKDDLVSSEAKNTKIDPRVKQESAALAQNLDNPLYETGVKSAGLQISPTLKELLKNAMSEAAKFNYRHVGTEHLLWVLIDNLKNRVSDEKKAAVSHIEAHLREIFTISSRLDYSKKLNLGHLISPRLDGAGILDAIIRDVYQNLRKNGPNEINKWQTNFMKNLPGIESSMGSSNNPVPPKPQDSSQPQHLSPQGDWAFESDLSPQKSALSIFAQDLVKLAKRGKLDPVIGQNKEMERLMTVLCRRTKNNPMLIGEPGVGKTALVMGLAQKIAKNEVPEELAKKRVYQLDLGLIVAGTMFRGEFEARFKEVLREAEEKQAIIFIDELHTVIGAGSAQGSLDAANMLKPLLPQNRFQVIGATTLTEWRRQIERDAALARRFQPIKVEEPGIKETKKILEGLKPHFENHHKIKILSATTDAVVELCHQYVTNRFFPDKAIDVLDEACAFIKTQNTKHKLQTTTNYQLPTTNLLTVDDVRRTVSVMTNIPVEKLSGDESLKFLNLEKILSQKIIGQNEAVKAVAQKLRRSRAGIAESGRPLGSFLFLGPTGVGKTELAKVLAEEVFINKNSLIRIDMSEYSEPHSVAKLIGSPPGYVGFEEGGWLTEKVRQNPYSVILFDEIEKAHPQLANILLQILEDGVLTDSHGQKINFGNTVVILTSNVGTKDFTQLSSRLGFVEDRKKTFGEKFGEIKQNCIKELRRRLRPELLSRIDQIIVFNPLGTREIGQIAKLAISDLQGRLLSKNIKFEIKKPVLEFLTRESFDTRLGARLIRKTINRHIENTLAEYIIKNPNKKKMGADMKNGKIHIS